MIPTRRARIAGLNLLLALLATSALPGAVSAHSPDPRLAGVLWGQDQRVAFAWRSGQVPPDWLAASIDAAAADVNASRKARAATFARSSSGTSLVAYGEPTGCSSAGIACFDRSAAPSSFRMWFRAHGYRFDWGTLRWCQAPASLGDGCFDAETIALDELGHVEILDHHVNYADGSDWTDAVVQALSHARPAVGWNQHAFGRCDVARLQLEYDRISSYDAISTCLSVATVTGLSPSLTSVASGTAVRFTATVRTSTDAAYRALAGDPLSGRSVLLQRRLPGASTWTTVTTMAASSTVAGSYAATLTLNATYEWRASFPTPAGDGAVGSASAATAVYVYACSPLMMCPTV